MTAQAGKAQVELLIAIIAQFQQLLQCNAAINNVMSTRGESKDSRQRSAPQWRVVERIVTKYFLT